TSFSLFFILLPPPISTLFPYTTLFRSGRGMFNSFHAGHFLLRWPLDHLFHSRHFTLGSLRRLPYFGSDHFPIFVELALEPEYGRSEEHTSELQSRENLVCRLLLEKKKS